MTTTNEPSPSSFSSSSSKKAKTTTGGGEAVVAEGEVKSPSGKGGAVWSAKDYCKGCKKKRSQACEHERCINCCEKLGKECKGHEKALKMRKGG